MLLGSDRFDLSFEQFGRRVVCRHHDGDSGVGKVHRGGRQSDADDHVLRGRREAGPVREP